jgi:hypothetical protein
VWGMPAVDQILSKIEWKVNRKVNIFHMILKVFLVLDVIIEDYPVLIPYTEFYKQKWKKFLCMKLCSYLIQDFPSGHQI